MRRFAPVFLALATAWLASCRTPPAATPADGPLILISLDGFRWDYLQKYEAPTLRRLASQGVHARRMTVAFPSKTFPNHYTLVTGLWPGHHGIVANSFHDPARNENFRMSSTETVWWDGGEPVWVTAEKQNVRTATFAWPGGTSEIRGGRPGHAVGWKRETTDAARVADLLGQLALPADQRPRFAALYFEKTDGAGHDHGPDSPEVAAAVRSLDDTLASLLDGLGRLGLQERANLVIVSDHGMSPISPDRVVFFEDLMSLAQVTIEASGPYGGVRPKPGVDGDALLAGMRAKAPPHVQVMRREELPARLHYGVLDRIPPILLLLPDGWSLEEKTGWPARRTTYKKGNHGWDPAVPNMGALFVAHGPAFRRGATLENVDNIDVYNLLCAVLGIAPAKNDGGDRLVRDALRN